MFRFVGADDGPLGDAVLRATDGVSGSGSQRGSKLALQHLQKWGFPTSGAHCWTCSLPAPALLLRAALQHRMLPGTHSDKA